MANAVFEMKNKTVLSYTGNYVSQGCETPWDGDWYIECSGGELRWTKNDMALRTTNLLQEVYTKKVHWNAEASSLSSSSIWMRKIDGPALRSLRQ